MTAVESPARLAVVLVHPEIPPNTGNVIRLTANTATALHLVEPLGFRMDDRELKRAGLDYHEYASVRVHRDFDACSAALDGEGPRRWFAFTTQAHPIVVRRALRRRRRPRLRLRIVGPAGCGARAIRSGRAAAHSDARGCAQPQSVECGRRRGLRGVAAVGVRRQRHVTSVSAALSNISHGRAATTAPSGARA